MVAAVTELMVGGERSTQDDSIKGSARTLVSKLRLRALLQATARTHLSLTTSSPLLTNTLTQTFLHSKLFSCIHTADHTFRQVRSIRRVKSQFWLSPTRRFRSQTKAKAALSQV